MLHINNLQDGCVDDRSHHIDAVAMTMESSDEGSSRRDLWQQQVVTLAVASPCSRRWCRWQARRPTSHKCRQWWWCVDTWIARPDLQLSLEWKQTWRAVVDVLACALCTNPCRHCIQWTVADGQLHPLWIQHTQVVCTLHSCVNISAVEEFVVKFFQTHSYFLFMQLHHCR